MHFCEIPAEIKLKIFSYFIAKEISKCVAQVCTEWWILSKDPSLWKSLELYVFPEKPADVYRQVIARCETSLTSLTLNTPTLGNELITYFRNFNLRKLKILHLRGWRYIYNSEMCNIISNSPNVEILSLRVSSVTCGLEHVSYFKNLKSLTICGYIFQTVDRADLELVVEKCTKLEALILQILDHFDDHFLLKLEECRNETLKHLVICRDKLTLDGIRALTSCQNLSTLCLKGSGCHLSTEMLVMLSTIQNLNWLDLGGTEGSDPQTWNIFFKSPNLSSLKILELSDTDIDDSGVVSLALTCRQLVIIDLSRNYILHDSGVKAVIDNCSKLWFLDISSTQVTRDILPYIPTKLPQLKYLNVQVCTGIDESDVKTFCLMCPRVQIRNEFEVNDVEYTVDQRLNVKWQS